MDTLRGSIRTGGTFLPRPGDALLWTTGADGVSRWALLGHDCADRRVVTASHDKMGKVLGKLDVCTPVLEPIRRGTVADGVLYDDRDAIAPTRL